MKTEDNRLVAIDHQAPSEPFTDFVFWAVVMPIASLIAIVVWFVGLAFILSLLCLAARGQVVSGLFTDPTNLAAPGGLEAPAPNLNPASVVDTNDYEETLEISWAPFVTPSGVPAACYHVAIETNGFARCGDYFTISNSLTVTLPATNQYRILFILPIDAAGDMLFPPAEDLSALLVEPIPATMVTIATAGPLGTVQNSHDLVNWTTIASGLMETNLTYSINRMQNNFWRTVPAQPMAIHAHY